MALGSGGGQPAASASGGDSVSVGAAVLRTAGQGIYRVDGSLRDIVVPSQWRFDGLIGVFCVFTQTTAAGRAWVEGSPGASARVVSGTPWGDETIEVRTSRPATLVRAEQFAPGWQATVSTGAGSAATASRPAAVVRHGLLQAVAVPAGRSQVRLVYRPRRALEGLAASGAGVLSIGLLATWPALRRRRARRQRAPAGPAPTKR
jgi:hypothetical protein